jgi:hypothetical protein
MQIINKTRKCDHCGCVTLLDSRICPKCGNSFIVKNDEFVSNLNRTDQISQLIKLLEFSNGVNIRFSFINKSQIDIDFISTCS